MKRLICLLVGVLAVGCATNPPQSAQFSQNGDVIELPQSETASGPRRFGFDCGVLLRDDFTLFHDGECQRQLAGRKSPPRQQPLELTVRELSRSE